MNLIVREITDEAIWNTFVSSHPEANFLQSWQWGEFQLSRNRKIVRHGVYDGDTLLGVYTGHIEPARRGRHMEVVGGPIVDWDDSDATRILFDDMHRVAKENKCVFVRVRPQLEDSPDAHEIFQNNKLKKAPMYLSVELAGVLDLTKSEEEITAGMSQSLRRKIRKAEKENITIEASQNPADIAEFYKIQLETARRHDFFAFSQDFLEKQFEAFAHTDNAILYTARLDGEILAQNFMIFYGSEASYHYGVSTSLGTKHSGAPLLHMRAMRDARERGIKRYNFWGIVDLDDTKHRFYGVSLFKRSFGVDELRYLPAHDIVVNPFAYLLTWTIETIRRKRRHV